MRRRDKALLLATVAGLEGLCEEQQQRIGNLAADLIEARAALHCAKSEIAHLNVALEAAVRDRDEARHER